MAYWGGGGVKGKLHPSLKVYIECFLSPPFPKMFPRGGGIYDQDPILLRDFRVIQKFEREWKQSQDQIAEMQNKGGGTGLDGALNEYIESMGEDPMF